MAKLSKNDLDVLEDMRSKAKELSDACRFRSYHFTTSSTGRELLQKWVDKVDRIVSEFGADIDSNS